MNTVPEEVISAALMAHDGDEEKAAEEFGYIIGSLPPEYRQAIHQRQREYAAQQAREAGV